MKGQAVSQLLGPWWQKSGVLGGYQALSVRKTDELGGLARSRLTEFGARLGTGGAASGGDIWARMKGIQEGL